MRSFTAVAALFAAFAPTAFAQTHTDCNIIKEKGCPNAPALGSNATFHFNATMNENIWRKKNQGLTEKGVEGVSMTVKRSGDSPHIVSTFYMLFGRLEVIMKAAKGTGIVSSAILQSEALDEIDWEFLGHKNEVLTNYFGKGDTSTFDRGKEYNLTESPADGFHNYTIDWTKDRTEWWMDGKLLRTLTPQEAKDGTRYPQTPMNVRIGVWAGGDKLNNDKGVVEWAGETNFDEAPFTMTVKSVNAIDYTTGAREYSFANMDESGSWEKVNVIKGKSKAIEEVENLSTIDKFKGLSQGAKIGIAAGVLGLVAIIAIGLFVYFLKQRRQGRREYEARRLADEREAAELLQHKEAMQSRFGRAV